MIDRARFYTIRGRRLVSVTTVLEVIAKPALGPWYAKQERLYFERALRAALRGKKVDRQRLLARVDELVRGAKAADREKARAAARGHDVHAAIEAYLKGREVELDPAHAPIFDAWKQWWLTSGLKPLAIEKTVYSLKHGYAGTLDLYAEVKGKPVVVDWKTSSAIYPEAYLQNVAYRAALLETWGLKSEAGLVVRLPRAGGAVEAKTVPVTVKFDDFLAALRLWRWWRRMSGLPTE